MSAAETFSALLDARHSCRAYLPDRVDAQLIEAAVRTAGRVPSWCNAQPWHLKVFDAQNTTLLRDALWEHVQSAAPAPDIPFPSGYSGAQQDRRRACGYQLYDAVGIAKGDRAASAAQMMQNFRFFEAPHVALLSTPKELGPYGLLDCGAFVTAFTLALEARGIASIPQAAIAAYAPFVRDFAKIDEGRDLVCAIAFGRRNETAPVNAFRTERAALGEIMEWTAL